MPFFCLLIFSKVIYVFNLLLYNADSGSRSQLYILLMNYVFLKLRVWNKLGAKILDNLLFWIVEYSLTFLLFQIIQ